MSGAIYSDAWYKIADAHVSLLPGVKATPQSYRGQAWIVLEDAYAHRFFRITPHAHDFLKTLNHRVSVDQAWQSYLQRYPQHAPGQEEVVQLLSQLHVSNLLYFRDEADTQQIDKRAQEAAQKELKAKALSFLYFRLPLFDPDKFLAALDRRLAVLPSTALWLVWLAVLIAGAAAALSDWDSLASSSQGAFAWTNLPWLYLCLSVMKVVHEVCHGLVCKRFGGSVHTFGLMFLVTTPLPYIDTTASWSFANRWHRMFVSAAGMMADIFMAALGALVWAATGPGLVNSLAFNVMLIGSVSSVVFNGNPLLRFDAYYVLADFLDIPNFYQKAQSYWFYLADKYLLGSHAARTPIDAPGERKWCLAYAPVSLFYRLLVSYAIVLFVMDLWFGLGVLVLCITAYLLLLAPMGKAIKHLAGPRVQTHRLRAWGITGLLIAAIGLALAIPLPYSIVASGVVQSNRAAVLYAPLDARLERLTLGNGQWVRAGEELMRFDSAPLLLEMRQLQGELDELFALQRQALATRMADLRAVEDQISAKQQRLAQLQRRRQDLTIQAPHDGRFVTMEGRERLGSWVGQGTELGHVLDSRSGYQFVAVITQERAQDLFGVTLGAMQVRLRGQAQTSLAADQLTVLPYQRGTLPSAALGWLGGGELPVANDDKRGEKAVEEFYEVRLQLQESPDPVELVHGLKGALRIELPERSIYQRVGQSLRQLMQKRYQLG